MSQQLAATLDVRRRQIVSVAEQLAEKGLTPQPNEVGAPHAALQLLKYAGLLTAPLPESLGGLGLGTEAGGHLPLLRILAAVGGADLALGRLYEGHVNGLILICQFGSAAQKRRAAEDARRGLLFGVWNTGDGAPMHITEEHGTMRLQGCKGFATGAAFVQRPIVTAEHHGWQMVLPRMEAPAVATEVRIDRTSWQPFGMERSESYTVDFTGAKLAPGDLIGAPGDFYRDPLFRGGAIRFAAVQAGAIARLNTMFADWLHARGRGGDPYQLQRMGETQLAAQEAVLWIERAAAVAERDLDDGGNPTQIEAMIECANSTRLAIERLATATMPRIIAGVGAHGLLRPHGFEQILRDLTMYLRQPNPDGTLADVGRSALKHVACKSGTAHRSLWRESCASAVEVAAVHSVPTPRGGLKHAGNTFEDAATGVL